MKNVRIWFTKENECKYISHLDLNRCMLRAVRRAQLPIWYTEGFNPHPFVTFPLPISLGIDGKRECMDIRIVDDSFDISLIPDSMNKYLPQGIKVFDATYPKLNPKFICFAKFYAVISVENMTGIELFDTIKDICKGDSFIVQKKSKAGMKDLDILPYIKAMEFSESIDNTCSFNIVLPAGNTKNIGLPLILKGIENHIGKEINYRIEKLDMYTEDMTCFE